MSNTDEQYKTNADGKKIVGEPADTARFQVGDLIQVHLEMKGQVFLTAPHGDVGIVTDLFYQDDEFYYHMPVIQFEREARMYNPDHVIIVQRGDGSPGELELLEKANAAAERQRLEDEKKAATEAT